MSRDLIRESRIDVARQEFAALGAELLRGGMRPIDIHEASVGALRQLEGSREVPAMMLLAALGIGAPLARARELDELTEDLALGSPGLRLARVARALDKLADRLGREAAARAAREAAGG